MPGARKEAVQIRFEILEYLYYNPPAPAEDAHLEEGDDPQLRRLPAPPRLPRRKIHGRRGRRREQHHNQTGQGGLREAEERAAVHPLGASPLVQTPYQPSPGKSDEQS